MFGLAFNFLFGAGFLGPAVTMVINTVSPENKGFAVNAFLFFATMAGLISTTIFGVLADSYDAKNNPKYYGYLLSFFVVIPGMLSIPFFYLAGISYREFKLVELEASIKKQLL